MIWNASAGGRGGEVRGRSGKGDDYTVFYVCPGRKGERRQLEQAGIWFVEMCDSKVVVV